jgi:hypothetical protein
VKAPPVYVCVGAGSTEDPTPLQASTIAIFMREEPAFEQDRMLFMESVDF